MDYARCPQSGLAHSHAFNRTLLWGARFHRRLQVRFPDVLWVARVQSLCSERAPENQLPRRPFRLVELVRYDSCLSRPIEPCRFRRSLPVKYTELQERISEELYPKRRPRSKPKKKYRAKRNPKRKKRSVRSENGANGRKLNPASVLW